MGGGNSSLGGAKLIRVIVADNTPMAAQLLADALKRSRRFGSVLTVHRSSDVLAAVADPAPDVAVISAEFGGDTAGGFKLAREWGAARPSLKIVMLLDRPDRASVVQAFRAGCRGVFCRAREVKDLLKCIACVEAGQIWGNTEEFGFVLEALREPQAQPLRVVNTAGVPLLTKREMTVVKCVVEGPTNRETATHLRLSEHTVKNYMFRIFDKLGVSSRVELILHVANQMQVVLAPGANPIPLEASGNGAALPGGGRVASGGVGAV